MPHAAREWSETMDVSAINAAVKATAAGVTASSASETGDPANAFATLLQQRVGPTFSAGMTLGGLETKLMRTEEPQAPRAPETQDNGNQNARAAAKPKASKSDTKKAANDDDKNGAGSTDNTDQTATTDTTAAQTQAVVQAATAPVTAQLPIVAQQQTTDTATASPEVVATAAATPVEQVAQAAAVTPQAAAVAAAVAAAPVVQAAAAQTAQQTTTPVVAQTKTDETAQTLTPVLDTQAPTQKNAAVDASALHAMGTDPNATAAAPQDAPQGPAVVRSAAATQQATNLNTTLGGDTKVQVQVQVTGLAVAAQAPVDPSPYNHYVGYTAAAETTTANGQAGVADPTNALVQNSKSPAEPALAQAALPPAPVAPQPPSPPAQQGYSSAAAADGPAPISASQGTASQGGPQNGSYTFDGFAPNAGTTATSNTNATKDAQASTDRPQVTAQQVVDQIKVSITRATKAGNDRVTIQLKPEELGRIEVKLEMSDDQKVHVTVTADNKDTLNLLQGDHKMLERALNDAGLRTDSNNLQFNLRSESNPQTADQGSGQGRSGQSGNGTSSGTDVAASESDFPTYDYSAAARVRGGVDTFA
jgi:flagellar hook-length control protein FliK